jgi:hypothetical protein
MDYYARTTQVPNRLFDEFLCEISFAELKVFLTVNRATWGWVVGKNGHRKERAWLSCSRMQAITGLSKRAITNAVAALVRRRLLCVFDQWGNPLEHPEERRGQTRLFYAMGFPQNGHERSHGSASIAEVDRHWMRIKETNTLKNQRTLSSSGRTVGANGHFIGRIDALLPSALAPDLWKRLQATEKRPVDDRSPN